MRPQKRAVTCCVLRHEYACMMTWQLAHPHVDHAITALQCTLSKQQVVLFATSYVVCSQAFGGTGQASWLPEGE